MKKLIILFCIMLPFVLLAQQNRIKAAAIVLPTPSEGFIFTGIGYERLNKKQTAGWQLHYHYARGSFISDIGETKRSWLTLERTYYTGKSNKVKFMYSLFTEAGTRMKYPGYIHPPADSIPRFTKYRESCTGATAGLHVASKKHIGLQLAAGPKLIFNTYELTKYYNSNTKTEYRVNYGSSVKAGFRATVCLYYGFGK